MRSAFLALILAYLLVMLPWFIRMMSATGSPLPSGGIETAFLRDYNDLFSYPAGWSFGEWLDYGAGHVLGSRLDGLLNAFGTWLIAEGMIVLALPGLWGAWLRRDDPLVLPFAWYALGLHVAMALVFTYPGTGGGLLHSAAAILPFWIALGLVGLDDVIRRLAKWRRWRVNEARLVLGSAVILLPVVLSYAAWSRQQPQAITTRYDRYADLLPADARLMVDNPAAWYYHTGLMGVTLPDEPIETAARIAERYCLTHLVMDQYVTAPLIPLFKGEVDPPPFLTEIDRTGAATPDDWSDDVRVYTFDIACPP